MAEEPVLNPDPPAPPHDRIGGGYPVPWAQATGASRDIVRTILVMDLVMETLLVGSATASIVVSRV